MPKLRPWMPTISWAALIFFLSSRPTVNTSQIYWQDFILKKAAHFVEYFILAWLTFRSLKHSVRLSFKSQLLLTVLLTFFYAASDEFHQSFVPGRGASIRDVIIDSVGILSAYAYLNKTHSDHSNTTG